MIILAIDPSINHTGWAVLEVRNPFVTVRNHGVWRPKQKDPYERLVDLCFRLETEIDSLCITDVVIETTSGKVSKRHKGGGAGLALYGVAVGGLYMAARQVMGNMRRHVHPVTENLWTGGQPKRSTAKQTGRHEQTLAEFGLPKNTTDHETDAIALGAWWVAHRRILAAADKEKPQCRKRKSPERTPTKKPKRMK